jgi:hypothetical protein
MKLAFLFAGSFQDADDSAVIDWQWERHDSLHTEFIRPDTRQLIRFVPDMAGTMTGFSWPTSVYLGRNHERRRDYHLIRSFLDAGFFVKQDPALPPPRERRSSRFARLTGELRDMLKAAEGRGR